MRRYLDRFFFKQKMEYEIGVRIVVSEMFIRVFFFFKQKTAYEIGVRLVGSEMCIRDRCQRGTWDRYYRINPD